MHVHCSNPFLLALTPGRVRCSLASVELSFLTPHGASPSASPELPLFVKTLFLKATLLSQDSLQLIMSTERVEAAIHSLAPGVSPRESSLPGALWPWSGAKFTSTTAVLRVRAGGVFADVSAKRSIM